MLSASIACTVSGAPEPLIAATPEMCASTLSWMVLRAMAMPMATAVVLPSPPDRSAVTAAAPSSKSIVAWSVAMTVMPVPLCTLPAFSIAATTWAAILFSV